MPPSTSFRSRAARRWRVRRRSRWKSSKRRTPRKVSRTMSRVQRSPMTERVRATEHFISSISDHRTSGSSCEERQSLDSILSSKIELSQYCPPMPVRGGRLVWRSSMAEEWLKTACILCSVNCGIEVKIEDRHITRVRGDRASAASHGYACEKAQRLDFYQNGRDRLTAPLRRRADGSFEEIDWETAIREVAAGFARVRDAWGGASIFYYGGGGQGNHLVGSYGASTRRALGMVYASNALAQEKTGEFWVEHVMFGTGVRGSFEQAAVAVFVGKNPWQSHGFQRARPILRDMAADPKRALVVIDPRRTETAEMADFHLRVRPGTDAFCLAALLGVLVQEDLVNHDFIHERAENSADLFAALMEVPVAEYCTRAGLSEDLVREVARRIARASSVSLYEDLGIEQAPHSTLNSYLEKLIFSLTGNLGKAGAMNAGTTLTGLFSGSLSSATSPVGGHRIIGGMIPANVIPDEILTDHPKRFRAMLVEAENPAHSVADS